MGLSNTISGLVSGLSGSIQSIIEQGLNTPMPQWQQTSQAQLTSTRATLAADGRVSAVIQSMTAMQSWNIDADLAGSANTALGGVMGSVAGLSDLVSSGINMTAGGTQVTHNSDGTVTVTTSINHDPGVARIMEQFADQSASPAEDTAAWLTSLLGQRGEGVTQSMANFSTNLPQQIPEFVQAGAASPALGAALVASWPAFY
ncbi:MAG: hypothetical protein PHR30_01370 [Gallionellaceae bacterium]|nr:hypothetical protein [Gallionellaceae bacterium]